MVETQGEGAVDRQRAAKPHAAIHRELRPALEQEPHGFEEILVPAHRDAVFGNAAEPGHDARVEPLVLRRDIADRREGAAAAVGHDAGHLGRQRLDLQPVDRGDKMPVIHQMMRQRKAGRAKPDDEHLVARCRLGQRPLEVERVPPRQQAVDLEAPRQPQHVFQGAGLDLRDVDRLLPLVDAGLHAIVADAVPGRGADRVVDRDDRQGAEAVAARLDEVHLGDLLVERAAGEGHAKDALLEAAVFFVETAAAAVLPLVVAPDAVIRLVQRTGEIAAGIGQREAVARPPIALRAAQHCDAVALDGCDRHEVVHVEPVRHSEQEPALVPRLSVRGQCRPGGVLECGFQRQWVRRLVLEPMPDRLGITQFPGEGALA